MRENPVQFAVVREDPMVEARLVQERAGERALLVASGGCTALSLQTLHPSLSMTLVDPNPHQLRLVRAKMDALGRLDEAERKARFNVGTERDDGLCVGGNFESLFRGWREFLHDLAMPREEVAGLFAGPGPLPDEVRRLTSSRYWPVSFDLFFSDSLLEALFGPEATQHAGPGSYPRYFQDRIERGLRRADAGDNYFLHHILLGHYLDRPSALPAYLAKPPKTWRIDLVETTMEEAPELAAFDLISLSNIFDWMPKERAEGLAARIVREAGPGATIVYRQLNNECDLEAAFAPEFEFSAGLGARLLETDRSCFYSSLHVGRRR